MSMRRSRIKLAPNLGAKSRASGKANSTPGEVRVKEEGRVKEELADDAKIKIENAAAPAAAAPATPAPAAPVEAPTPVPVIEAPTPSSTPIVTDPSDAPIPAVTSPTPISNDATPKSPDKGPKILNSGDIIPFELLKAANKITEITPKGEDIEARNEDSADSDSERKDPSKPGQRVRSWFPKAKPNLAEAGRARLRHNSFSGDEDTRSTPSITRITSRVRQTSTSEPTLSDCYAALLKEEAAKENPPDAPVVELPPEKERPPPNINNSLGIDMGCATRKPKVEKDEEHRRKVRKVERLDAPVDRTKITMKDLIYMNPVNNPMSRLNGGRGGRRKSQDGKIVKSESEDEMKSVAGDVSQADIEIIQKKDETDPTIVPQVKIGANGEIIINESSLLLENKDPEADARAAKMELIHESDLPALPFAYGHKTPNRLWTEMETKKFYLALSTVGTDFSLMAKLFPKRNRTELKRKFKREEKCNRYLIDKAIRERQHFDQQFFDDLAALEIEEPKPKRQRKRKDTSTTDDEDQENKREKAAKKTKRAPRAKVVKSEGKDGEAEGETKPAVKKRAKKAPKPKETTDVAVAREESAVQETKPQRPKRKRKPKGLTYIDSDTEEGEKDKDADKDDGSPETKKKTKRPRAKKASAVKKDSQESNIESATIDVNTSNGGPATGVEGGEDTDASESTLVMDIPDIPSEGKKKGKGKGKKSVPAKDEGEPSTDATPASTKPKRARKRKSDPSPGTEPSCDGDTPTKPSPKKKTVKRTKKSKEDASTSASQDTEATSAEKTLEAGQPLSLEIEDAGEGGDEFALPEGAVGLMSPAGTIEKKGNTTTLRHGSYLFVASTPPGEEDAEPLIHVYLVSPNGEEDEKNAPHKAAPKFHPTPSPMGSPTAERSAEISLPENTDVSNPGASPGPHIADTSQTEFVYTEEIQIVDGNEIVDVTSESSEVTKLNAVTEIDTHNVSNEPSTPQISMEKVKTPTKEKVYKTMVEKVETPTKETVYKTMVEKIETPTKEKVDKTTVDSRGTTEGKPPSTISQTVMEKEVPSNIEELPKAGSPPCKTSPTPKSKDEANISPSASPKFTCLRESPAPKETSPDPSPLPSSPSPSPSSSTSPSAQKASSSSDINVNKTVVVNQPKPGVGARTTESSTGKSGTAPSAAPPAKGGRRRRIAAMPNIGSQRKPRPLQGATAAASASKPPAGGSIVATPTSNQTGQVAAAAPPGPSSSTDAGSEPPIDDATAGHILVELSMSGGED